jgi:hypothetical protein
MNDTACSLSKLGDVTALSLNITSWLPTNPQSINATNAITTISRSFRISRFSFYLFPFFLFLESIFLNTRFSIF